MEHNIADVSHVRIMVFAYDRMVHSLFLFCAPTCWLWYSLSPMLFCHSAVISHFCLIQRQHENTEIFTPK
jgi:hypothetical protein